MTKRRFASIKFNKDSNITQFAYFAHNGHKVTHSNIEFDDDSLIASLEVFLRGLIERHYPAQTKYDFKINNLSMEFEYNDPKKLTFALTFNDEKCGEIIFFSAIATSNLG